MKKQALILSIALIAFTGNVFGSNKDNKASNHTNTPYSINVNNGIETKVYITSDEKSGELQTRTVYMTEVDGKRLGTITYSWDNSIGWVQSSKTEYVYNQQEELIKIVKSKWNSNTSEWTNKLEQNIQTH